jgi:hypothetical protein
MGVMEVPVKPQDVRMAEIHLDAYFPPDLDLDLIGHNLRLSKLLQGEDEVWRVSCANHVYSTEFAASERTAEFE